MILKTRLCYKIVLIAVLFGCGLVIAGVIFPTLGVLCKPRRAKHYRETLKFAWLKWFAAILNLQITHEGQLPTRGNVWVSNHISWLDIIVLGQFAPAHFVAKSDVLAWPIIGYLARQGGTIFVRRGDKQQVKAIAEALVWLLKQSSTVIAFPEGTTTKGDMVLPFHASLLQAALLTKVSVQPIALRYEGEAKSIAPFIGDDDFVPHLIRMLSLDKIAVHIVFHPAISTAGKNRQSVSNEARGMIMESITGTRHVNPIYLANVENPKQVSSHPQ
jgi:lyso-ornithine lipid O-acyltransferase